MTQLELAKALGRSQPQVSSIESGDKQIDVLEYLRWMNLVGATEESMLDHVRELNAALLRHGELDAATKRSSRIKIKNEPSVSASRRVKLR